MLSCSAAAATIDKTMRRSYDQKPACLAHAYVSRTTLRGVARQQRGSPQPMPSPQQPTPGVLLTLRRSLKEYSRYFISPVQLVKIDFVRRIVRKPLIWCFQHDEALYMSDLYVRVRELYAYSTCQNSVQHSTAILYTSLCQQQQQTSATILQLCSLLLLTVLCGW